MTASRLRIAREARKLTLADLAARIGRSESTLSKVETGARNPSGQLLRSIITALQINREWLENGSEPMFTSAPDILPMLPEVWRLKKLREDLSRLSIQFAGSVLEIQAALTEARREDPLKVKQYLQSAALWGMLDHVSELHAEADLLAAFRESLLSATARRGARSELARLLGVSPQAVSGWLSSNVEERSYPSAGKLLQVLEWIRLEEARKSKLETAEKPPLDIGTTDEPPEDAA